MSQEREKRDFVRHPYTDEELNALMAQMRPDDPIPRASVVSIRMYAKQLGITEEGINEIISHYFDKPSLGYLSRGEAAMLYHAVKNVIAKRSAVPDRASG